ALGQQVFRRGLGAAVGVGEDGVDGGAEAAVDHHLGDAGGGEAAEVGVGAVRGDDHAGGLLGDGEFDVGGLLGFTFVGVAQDDRVAVLDGDVFDAAGGGGEEGDLDVGDDQEPEVGALAAEVAGDVVGAVAEFLRGGAHSGGEFGVDAVVVVEGTGNGGDRGA